jgi:hypothetical protein
MSHEARQAPSWLIFDVRRKTGCTMNKLKLAGWSFIPIGMIFAIVGIIYQERAGGMAKSPEAHSAGGAFLACLGAAGLLLTVDADRRGVLEEEDRVVAKKERPIEFRAKLTCGYLFWSLFVVVGLVTAVRVWTK